MSVIMVDTYLLPLLVFLGRGIIPPKKTSFMKLKGIIKTK